MIAGEPEQFPSWVRNKIAIQSEYISFDYFLVTVNIRYHCSSCSVQQVRPDERKLLQVNRVLADVVVAQDGTGNFTSVQEAVMAAPDYSPRRFVIHVKKGVYKGNVEIKKKKWNIMMVGEGMDVTVISGNRSFTDGWTTFRSATFGKTLFLFLLTLISRIGLNSLMPSAKRMKY